MTAGSQNRDHEKRLKHIQRSINLNRPCKCIIHRTPSGEGTLLPATAFNRQGDGWQSMCREGKTLIDALKHGFWRYGLFALYELGRGTSVAELVRRTFSFSEACQYPALSGAFKSILEGRAVSSFLEQPTDTTVFLTALSYLEDELQVAKVGFYDASLSLSYFEALKAHLHELTSQQAALVRDFHDSFVDGKFLSRESSDTGLLLPVEDFSFNYSKKNQLYNLDGSKSPFRAHQHNTVKKQSSEGHRFIKYLTQTSLIPGAGGFLEADRYIQRNRPPGCHADHRFPLRLGGIHATSNLEFLVADSNLKKSDSLTWPVAHAALSRPLDFLAPDAFAVFARGAASVTGDVSWAAKQVEVEESLRQWVSELVKKFGGLSLYEKDKQLSVTHAHLSAAQRTTFIDRFMRIYPP